MKVLDADVWLAAARPDVFAFFANAENLEAITPPWLRFRLTTPTPITITTGTMLDYRLRVHGIPLAWRSSITVWDPPRRFVDEQLRGPYRRWTHTHSFEEERGGTRVRDHVEFAAPGGRLVEWLVMRDVRRIFDYRQNTLQQIFASRR